MCPIQKIERMVAQLRHRNYLPGFICYMTLLASAQVVAFWQTRTVEPISARGRMTIIAPKWNIIVYVTIIAGIKGVFGTRRGQKSLHVGFLAITDGLVTLLIYQTPELYKRRSHRKAVADKSFQIKLFQSQPMN